MSWMLAILSVVSLVLVQWSQEIIFQHRGEYKRKNPLVYPPQSVRHMSFGYHLSLSDSLWLRALQDFDFCGQKQSEDKQPEPEKSQHRCIEGWSFQMLDAATNLDPRFWIVYRTGAVFLSVVVDDIRGATRLFYKGLEQYPEDWPLLYRAAYHQMAEEKDLEAAADLFHRAGLHGAPEWVNFLAAKLYSDIGQIEIGFATLQDMWGELPFEEWPERAKERWRELEQRRAELSQ